VTLKPYLKFGIDYNFCILASILWARWPSSYSELLRAGRSGDRIPVGEGGRFSAHVQNGPGAYPTSCTMCTESFPGVKSGRGMTLTPHPLLVSWSWKGRAIPLLPLWAVRPVQSLSACTRVQFTFLPLCPFYHLLDLKGQMNFISFVKTATYTENVSIEFSADALCFVAQFEKLFCTFHFYTCTKEITVLFFYYDKLVSALTWI
jgi:hypothetical protein